MFAIVSFQHLTKYAAKGDHSQLCALSPRCSKIATAPEAAVCWPVSASQHYASSSGAAARTGPEGAASGDPPSGSRLMARVSPEVSTV